MKLESSFAHKNYAAGIQPVQTISNKFDSTELEGGAKAYVVVVVVRRVVVTVRRTAIVGRIPVTATTVDAVRALWLYTNLR